MLALLELLFLLFRTVRTVSPNFFAALRLVSQHGLDHLAVVDAGISASLLGYELGVFVDVDVVFVAVVLLPILLCPARIGVFLRQLGFLGSPFDRHRSFFDESVFFSRVSLYRHGDKGGINDLPTFELDSQLQ